VGMKPKLTYVSSENRQRCPPSPQLRRDKQDSLRHTFGVPQGRLPPSLTPVDQLPPSPRLWRTGWRTATLDLRLLGSRPAKGMQGSLRHTFGASQGRLPPSLTPVDQLPPSPRLWRTGWRTGTTDLRSSGSHPAKACRIPFVTPSVLLRAGFRLR